MEDTSIIAGSMSAFNAVRDRKSAASQPSSGKSKSKPKPRTLWRTVLSRTTFAKTAAMLVVRKDIIPAQKVTKSANSQKPPHEPKVGKIQHWNRGECSSSIAVGSNRSSSTWRSTVFRTVINWIRPVISLLFREQFGNNLASRRWKRHQVKPPTHRMIHYQRRNVHNLDLMGIEGIELFHLWMTQFDSNCHQVTTPSK